jgi:hypothetical protein
MCGASGTAPPVHPGRPERRRTTCGCARCRGGGAQRRGEQERRVDARRQRPQRVESLVVSRTRRRERSVFGYRVITPPVAIGEPAVFDITRKEHGTFPSGLSGVVHYADLAETWYETRFDIAQHGTAGAAVLWQSTQRSAVQQPPAGRGPASARQSSSWRQAPKGPSAHLLSGRRGYSSAALRH